jgi:arylsulfatase A-like enzyme
MKRREFIKSFGDISSLMLTIPFLCHCSKFKTTKPNIVLIFTDDMDFDEISPYDPEKFPSYSGAKMRGIYREQDDGWFVQNNRRLSRGEQGYFQDQRMLTPNIDNLAKEGVLFTRFYVTTSICTPSRYSLLTGRYATRSPSICKKFKPGTQAKLTWNSTLDASESSIIKELNKVGYTTGFVGKWHNGAPGAKAQNIPANADPNDDVIAKKIRDAYQRGVGHLKENIGFDFVERVYFQNKESLGVPDRMKVHNLEWITEGALKFIDQTRNRPFFLYMPLTIPHGQYYLDWIKDDPLATPAGMLDKETNVQPSRESIFKRLEAAGISKRNAMATWIDDSIAAVLKKLDELNLAENTIIIFLSDHQSRGKFTCYESCRVPCLIRWPGQIEPGNQIGEICSNIDIVPTLIELSGGSPPPDMMVDGKSILSLLTNKTNSKNWREALLLECGNTRAIVTQKWKYIANRPSAETKAKMAAEAKAKKNSEKKRRIDWSGRENWHLDEEGVVYGADRDFPHYFDEDQLYDLENDAFEQNNLIHDQRYTDVLEKIKNHMKRIIKTLPHTFGEF